MSTLVKSGIYQESFESNIPSQIILKSGDKLILNHDQYTVLEPIGQGGFGSVYKIVSSNSAVLAIKILDLWRLKPNEFEEISARFKQGFQAGQIDSDFLVKNLYEGRLEGNPYIIMEYCPNGNLNDRKAEFYFEYKFSRLFISVLKGLQDLHQNGVIHRDIKPDNILFTLEDNPKLTDFDIVGNINKRMTAANWLGAVKDIWGTAVYAPPEQLNHKKSFAYTKPSMDVFAFGVTMYEVLSGGHYPFGPFEEFENNPIAYYDNIKSGNFKPIINFRNDLSPLWIDIVHKCIQSDPANRFQSPREILDLLVFKEVNVLENKFKKIEYEKLNSGPLIHKNWKLKILNGEEIGKEYVLSDFFNKNQNLLRIGWNKVFNQIAIRETYTKFISEKHATIEKYHDKLFIRDGQWTKTSGWKKSTNGTMVNQYEVDHNLGFPISYGDIITIGEVTLKLLSN